MGNILYSQNLICCTVRTGGSQRRSFWNSFHLCFQQFQQEWFLSQGHSLLLQATHSLTDSAQDWIQQQFSKLPGAGRSLQLHVICEQMAVSHVAAVSNDTTQWQGVHGELHLVHHISILYIVGWDALSPPKPVGPEVCHISALYKVVGRDALPPPKPVSPEEQGSSVLYSVDSGHPSQHYTRHWSCAS